MPPRKYMVNDSSMFMETLTKKGRPVWKRVRPTQYMISEPTNVRKLPLRNVAPRDLSILTSEGLVSTNSFSLRQKVGISIQMQATTASTIKQMR